MPIPNETINSVSPDLRDWLLNKNIIADSITDNSLDGLLEGIGKPVVPSTDPIAVQASDDLEVLGDAYRDLNTLNNAFFGDNDDYSEVNIESFSVPVEKFGTYDASDSKLVEESDEYRDLNALKNKYIVEDQQELINLNSIGAPTIQLGSYLDENGELTIGGPSTQPLDVAGSILTGRGVGFTPDGPEPNFDVRSTIAGRVLGGSGAINDSQLGQIGGQQLTAHLGYNAAFNLQEETIGRINTNIFSLIGGDSLVVPNYQITVPKGKLGIGKVLDFGARVLGFEVPISLLEKSSSIFNRESPLANIERSKEMIDNTGKGQVNALIANLQENKYQYQIDDDRKKKNTEREGDKGTNAEIYAYGDSSGGILDVLNHKDVNAETIKPGESFLISQSNFKSVNDDFENLTSTPTGGNLTHRTDGEGKFVWGDTRDNRETFKHYFEDTFTVKKGLLYKTQEMFKTNNMGSLVSGKGTKVNSPNREIGNFQVVDEASYMSKGSAVLSPSAIAGTSGLDIKDIFCRTWTTFDKYNQVFDLQKNRGLDALTNRNGNESQSVLDDNGFVKVAPYKDDIKKYMFSIENLAWHDRYTDLIECEQGPGDTLTGAHGRIMWFPPYEMSFNDTSSVEWEANKFIGRGEPLYTYNNTERKGNLQWKIIVDHNTFQNQMVRGGIDEQSIISFNAGCDSEIPTELLNLLTTNEKRIIETKTNQEKPTKSQKADEPLMSDINIYFPNDSDAIPKTYEDGTVTPDEKTQGEGIVAKWRTKANCGKPYRGFYPNTTDFGLNTTEITYKDNKLNGWLDFQLIDTIKTFLITDCKTCKVKITGYVSGQVDEFKSNCKGYSQQEQIRVNEDNQKLLAEARAKNIADKFQSEVFVDDADFNKRVTVTTGIIPDQIEKQGGQDSKDFKLERKVTVEFSQGKGDDTKDDGTTPDPQTVETETLTVNSEILGRFHNECDYFEKLRQEDKFVYNKLTEKFKYFSPAFHSTTPEGFNSRLTFLKQCTRQGPTKNPDSNPDNLAFGRPPVCILRVGDFYHTKIVIDNMSFSFDPLVWDLNPEGIGVQPMIATVDMSFSFIGGSSLGGPINRLQNALSFNYFGNTELYDPRADRVVKVEDPKNGVTGEIENGWLTKLELARTQAEAEAASSLKDNTVDLSESQKVVAEIANAGNEEGNETVSPNTATEVKTFYQLYLDGPRIFDKNLIVRAPATNDDNVYIDEFSRLDRLKKVSFRLLTDTDEELFYDIEGDEADKLAEKGIKVKFEPEFPSPKQINTIIEETGITRPQIEALVNGAINEYFEYVVTQDLNDENSGKFAAPKLGFVNYKITLSYDGVTKTVAYYELDVVTGDLGEDGGTYIEPQWDGGNADYAI